ncbi:TPA: hypothetical protein U2M28_004087 [Providencia stuartii]|uniref:hypothetical protein n=1 Tax=Providencia TaxID=586 RepID=UPI00090C74A6|nr:MULTISPECIES: hypothetical protein [Providencia]APG50393.1 hypothetical protein BGK56_05255 [Providencia stuartii]AVL39880.1 hypothetical protein CEP70_07680 [Providencia stuartii]MBG5902639.1 hypothetical protein [Providencia stuartii]MBG5910382.1 hypothetical protein [Providencia stuartii]MBG5914212.1 hypothetical protein [Providencia stuartii]
MKLQLIESTAFVTVIFISMILIGKNFNLPKESLFPAVSINEIHACTKIKSCIANEKITKEVKNGTNPMKEIKTFIRQKIY